MDALGRLGGAARLTGTALPEPTPREAVSIGARLALAHHPLCSTFRSDVVLVGGVAVCAGCLALWPAVLVGFPLGLMALLRGADALPLLVASVTTGWAQLAGTLRRGSRAERAMAKGMLGLGIGVGLAALLAVGLPGLAIAAMVAAGGVGAVVLQVVRARSILRTCDACPYRRDWAQCPAFRWPAPATAGTGAPADGLPSSLLRAPRRAP